MAGQIVAIADVFDAISSHRIDKPYWSIEESADKHFDPALIPAFRTALPEMLKIRALYADTQETLVSNPSLQCQPESPA